MSLSPTQEKLAKGLSGWLTFEFNCMRGYLFSEKYLTLPVGQLLLASCKQLVRSEVDHPVLARPGRPGRPAQVDFTVGPQDAPILVVETKWLGDTSPRHSDILWDLVRLELAATHWKCDALFVLAGLHRKVTALFESSGFSYQAGNGKLRTLLPIEDASRSEVRVQHAPATQRRRIERELREFDGIGIPSTITCNRPHWHPKACNNLTFSTWVWRIVPSKRRQLFFLDAQLRSQTSRLKT
jgi:hypothetical protein